MPRPLGFVRSTKRLGATTSRLELLRRGEGASGRVKPGARVVDEMAISKALAENLRRPVSR